MEKLQIQNKGQLQRDRGRDQYEFSFFFPSKLLINKLPFLGRKQEFNSCLEAST